MKELLKQGQSLDVEIEELNRLEIKVNTFQFLEKGSFF